MHKNRDRARRILPLLMAGTLCGAAGCERGPEILPGFVPPTPPDNGMQIITPIVRGLGPGTDNELCTWTDVITDRDLDIRAASSAQSETGHHVVIYRTDTYEPAGTTRPCRDEDMATFRFVIGIGGEGNEGEERAPGNLVYRVPKGSQIVLNQHFLNYTAKTVDAQSSVNIVYAEPGKSYINSGTLAILDTEIQVKQGLSSTEIKATMKEDQKLWRIRPHMHRWGKHIKVEWISQQETRKLFDLDWSDQYTFHPPTLDQAPATPMIFRAGDEVRVRCEWENNTGKVLTFGFEMCVTFAQTVDDSGRGNIAWDGKSWVDY